MILFRCFLFLTPIWAVHENLPDSFKLKDLTVVGAHNAHCSWDEGWLYYQQNLCLEKLIDNGVRAFKVNLHWYKPPLSNDSYIALAHEPDGKTNSLLSVVQRGGRAPKPAFDFFKRLALEIKKNKKDVFFLILENYLGHHSKKNGRDGKRIQDSVDELNKILKESGLAEHAYVLNKRQQDKLGDLRRSDKRLIILVDDSNFNDISYVNWSARFLNNNHWETKKVQNFEMFRYMPWNPFAITYIGLGPEASIPYYWWNGWFLKWIQSLFNAPVAVRAYSEINGEANVEKTLHVYEKKYGLYTNIIGSDYSELGDLLKVAQKRNKKKLDTMVSSE